MRRPPVAWSDRVAIAAVFSLAALALLVLVGPSLIVVAISFDTRSFVSFLSSTCINSKVTSP